MSVSRQLDDTVCCQNDEERTISAGLRNYWHTELATELVIHDSGRSSFPAEQSGGAGATSCRGPGLSVAPPHETEQQDLGIRGLFMGADPEVLKLFTIHLQKN